MFEAPYQTTPCRRFSLEKTIIGVRKLEINDDLVSAPNAFAGVKLVPPGTTGDFPPFQQPLTQLDASNLENKVIIDGRQLLRANGQPVKTDTFNHAILMANLTSMWLYQPGNIRKDMLNLGDFPAKVFGSWVGHAITNKLSLDPGQAAIVRALTTIYYIQLFEPLPEHATDDDRDRILIRAQRVIPGVDYDTLAGIAGEVPRLNNLADFVAWVKQILQSPRTEQLNISLLYTALGWQWGPQYHEAVAVSLEYPPIFLALVYSTCLQHSYSKTGLGQVIERVVSRDSDREYIKNVNHLLASVG